MILIVDKITWPTGILIMRYNGQTNLIFLTTIRNIVITNVVIITWMILVMTDLTTKESKTIWRFNLHGYHGISGAFRITHHIIFFMYGVTCTPLLALKTIYSPLATERRLWVLIWVQKVLPKNRRLLHKCIFLPDRIVMVSIGVNMCQWAIV